MFARRGANADAAAELAQRTWTVLWESLRNGGYDPARAAPSTFVYAIANHVWLWHLRERPRVPQGDPPDQPAHAPPAAEFLAHCELLDALRDCIGREPNTGALDDTERALVLALGGGASEREVAVQLGLAASTVNARKQAAYVKLRKCLGRKGFSRESIEQSRLDLE